MGTATLAALAGGAITFGAGTSDKPIKACVKKRSGALRVVSASTRCRRGERALAWNLRGQTGPRGAQGAPGVRGADGAPGGRGPAGANGEPGTMTFHDLDGMPCSDGAATPTLDITYDSDGYASFRC